MYRDLMTGLLALMLLPALPVFAAEDEEEEETGITAGLIEKDKHYGEIDRFYDDVAGAEENDVIDPAAAWRVENLVVEMDSATITFIDGEFFPRVGIEGEVYGAVYIGRGRWQFDTDLELEQDEMERIIRERSLDKEFTNSFMQFSPQYLDKFKEGALAASGDEDQAQQAQRYWDKRRKVFPGDFDWSVSYYHVEGIEYFDEIHIEANLEKIKLVLDTQTGGVGTMVYTYDSQDTEEITLWRYKPNPSMSSSTEVGELVANVYDMDVLCSFPRKVDRENLSRRELAYKDASVIDVQHYVGDFEIYEDPHTHEYGLKGDVTVTFTPVLRDLNVVPFSLINWMTTSSVYTRSMKVQGVLDTEGNLLPYVHKFHGLAVELPEPAQVGEQYSIRVVYGGEIIDSITQPDPEMSIREAADAQAAEQAMGIVNYTLLNTYPWFPQNASNFWDTYTFEWTVKLPKPFLLASSGTMVNQEDTGKHYVYTIKENVPSALASIIFGRFSLVADDPSLGKRPYVRVFAHAGQVDSAREILEQTHDIIEYFEELYQAPYIYPEIDIAQMPYGVGFAQAPPGLVQMDGVAYLNKTLLVNIYNVNNPFLREAFLPHEIAHQWWGHKVTSLTDHDYWLMEAGAEYSAALFSEAADGEKAYEQYVKYWENRRAAKNTRRTMAVWMGATGRDPKRYVSTIYGRGPLLMHDLREQLGYQKIVSVLRAMLHEWDGGKFATEDFKMVLEKATGKSFDSYFENYVYRNVQLGSVPEDQLLPPLEDE